jgi:hypothetical protein
VKKSIRRPSLLLGVNAGFYSFLFLWAAKKL